MAYGCIVNRVLGLAGVVQSYNWLAQTTQIRGMNYMNCFRQEEGFCSIEYTVSSAADTPVDYFNLGGGNAMVSFEDYNVI